MAAAAPGRCAGCSVARAAAVAALLALPPLCNIFVPSSETLRACLLLIYQIWVWPVAICSKSPATLGAAGFALLAGAAVQKVKWDISSGFFGHIVAGMALIAGGRSAILGRGEPVTARWFVAALGCVMFAFATGSQYYHTILGQHPPKLMHLVHTAIYAIAFTLALIIGMPDFLRSTPRLQAYTASMLEARQLMDPACLLALGVLLYTHRHDPSEIGTQMHLLLGVLLVLLSLVQLLHAVVHNAFDAAAAVSKLTRRLTGFCWCLTGLWLVHMAFFLYVSGDEARGKGRGIHHLIWRDKEGVVKEPLPTEGAGFYLACEIIVGAVLVLAIGDADADGAQRARDMPDGGYRASMLAHADDESEALNGKPVHLQGGDEA